MKVKINTFDEIAEKIKDIISHEIKGKVFDKDVAEAIGMEVPAFYQLKHRGSAPYEKIMDFCYNRKISVNEICYNQKLKEV